MNEIDVKNCPCYIDRPLYRYDKGCLIQSQAFSEQQTKEKPILRCDEIVGCSIKEHYKQLQQLKQENEELRSDNSMLLAQGDADAFVISNLNFKIQKLQQCLNEIEECIKCCATTLYGCVNCKKGDECNGALSDLILQLIKQVKECE